MTYEQCHIGLGGWFKRKAKKRQSVMAITPSRRRLRQTWQVGEAKLEDRSWQAISVSYLASWSEQRAKANFQHLFSREQ
jgi:hypothetical protein